MFRRVAAFAMVVAVACAPRARGVMREVPIPLSGAWMQELAASPGAGVLRVDLRALRADALYAPALRALDVALTGRALSPSVDVSRALSAAGEVVVLFEGQTPPVVVLRGVPASIDPTRAAGADGAAQWRRSPLGVAHVDAFDFVPAQGALFVLLDRSWVLSAGEGEARLRRALGREHGRPVFAELADVDPAPVSLHLSGGALRAMAPRAHVSLLEPMFRELRSFDLSLRTGSSADARSDAVTLDLSYAAPPEAERARELVGDLIGAFMRRGGPRWAWLSTAAVAQAGPVVHVRAGLPQWLLGALGDDAMPAAAPDPL